MLDESVMKGARAEYVMHHCLVLYWEAWSGGVVMQRVAIQTCDHLFPNARN